MHSNIDREKLKALALAATMNHGPRRVETDYNGVHQVLGDGSWKILTAWHTPDGKGMANAEFSAAASPATILALLAEIERLETGRSKKERELEQELRVWRTGPACWTCGDTGDVHDITGEWRGECDCLSAQLVSANRERGQLKAENEALRQGMKGDYDLDAWLAFVSEESELRKDAERYRWLRDKSESVHQFYLSTPIWFTGVKFSKENVDSTIDATMTKEAGNV